MRSRWTGFQSVLAKPIERYLAYKRALGRRFDYEEKELRVLDRYLVDQGIETLDGVTSKRLDQFLASRPRERPRSYNQLLGALRRLFDWMVVQGLLENSPLLSGPRRVTERRLPSSSIPPRHASC